MRVVLLVIALVSLQTQAKHRPRPHSPPRRAPANTNINRDALFKILSAENQRNGKDPYLATAIHHPTPAIRQAALFAVARIGDTSLVSEISEQLNKKSGSNKSDAIFALGLLPEDTALTMAVQHL